MLFQSIKKTLALILTVCMAMACKQGWTDKNKQEFLGGCISGAEKNMDAAKAKPYCICMLQKLQTRYSSPVSLQFLKNDTALYNMGKACLK